MNTIQKERATLITNDCSCLPIIATGDVRVIIFVHGPSNHLILLSRSWLSSGILSSLIPCRSATPPELGGVGVCWITRDRQHPTGCRILQPLAPRAHHTVPTTRHITGPHQKPSSRGSNPPPPPSPAKPPADRTDGTRGSLCSSSFHALLLHHHTLISELLRCDKQVSKRTRPIRAALPLSSLIRPSGASIGQL